MGDWINLKNFDVVDEDEPIADNPNLHGWATDGHNQLAGNGSITKRNCGTFANCFYECDREDLHKGKEHNGESATGKGYFRPIFHSCHRLSCPICYESACAREGHAIEDRLVELSKTYGLVEHFVASVPLEKYWMAENHPNELRRFMIKALERRGVFGGAMIPHHFRYDKYREVWYRSLHFHVLGWVKGGYGRCRACMNRVCEGYNREFERCHGFEAETRRCFEVDGVIVKVAVDKFGVASERKSIFYTAQYQLSHSSIRTDVKRAHAVFWFGVASYHKFRFKAEKHKGLCPICGSELHRVRFVGNVTLLNFGAQVFVTNRCSPLFKGEFLFPLRDRKRCLLWEPVLVCGSGSYERWCSEG
jgi:hypothetical protein